MHLEKSETWRKIVGARLGAFREAIGKKQAEMARLLEISYQRWNNYEKGRRPVDIEFAIDLCRFGMTLDYLYRGNMAGMTLEMQMVLRPLDQEVERLITSMH